MLQMLHYDRIDKSERIDLIKSRNSEECMIIFGFLIMDSNFKIPYALVIMI